MLFVLAEGLHVHIGSQITSVTPYIDTAKILKDFIKKVQQIGIELKFFDLGGGIGINYENQLSIAGNEKSLVELEAGRILSRDKKYSSAMEHLNSAIRILPKSALAWYELGRCQRQLGFSEAKTSLRQCLDIRPLWGSAENELRKVKDRGFLYRAFKQIFRK